MYCCNQTVLSDNLLKLDTCNRTVEAANQTKYTQLNPPIIELIIMTIAVTTYPKKGEKMRNLKNGGILI